MINTSKTRPIKRMARDLKYERAKLMYQYRDKQGMRLERIARMFGMSRQRVYQILKLDKGKV